MSEDNYHNRLSKFIATKLYDCPNSEPRKISADIRAHQIGCIIRKRIQTGQYTVDTSVIPTKINDGCSLGVAITGEVLLS